MHILGLWQEQGASQEAAREPLTLFFIPERPQPGAFLFPKGGRVELKSIKFVLAVDSEGNALIADTEKPEGYDVFAGPWADENQIENVPEEPGLYNCIIQLQRDGLDVFFVITSAVKVARFDFGEAVALPKS